MASIAWLWAPASVFLHEATFRCAVERAGLNPYLYEHANLREQCSWAHRHDPEGATEKAIRMISAAVGHARTARPLDQIRLPNHRTALIVGGGIAGMKAALDLAKDKVRVVLVEPSGVLGGRLIGRGPAYPSEAEADEIVGKMQAEIEKNPHIELLLNSRVTSVSGFIGNFNVTVEGALGPSAGQTAVSIAAGVLVVATGFHPYVPANGEFQYGEAPGVVTMPEFIQILRDPPNQGPTLTREGRPLRRIAFIHCVGSRQVDGVHEPGEDGRLNTYCSRVCCTTALQQEVEVRQRFPETEVFDLYQDIRTYGTRCGGLLPQSKRSRRDLLPLPRRGTAEG